MKYVCWIAKLLVVVGALNWGLVGFFGYDLVGDIFGGSMTAGARIIYGLVGLAGLLMIIRCCCCCSKSSCSKGSCGTSPGSGCNCGGHCNEDCKCTRCGSNCNCGCKKGH